MFGEEIGTISVMNSEWLQHPHFFQRLCGILPSTIVRQAELIFDV